MHYRHKPKRGNLLGVFENWLLLRIFPVRNYFLTCANIGLRGRDLLLIADQKTYQKVQPD